MKKLTLSLIFLLVVGIIANAQSVGVNPEGNPPHESAGLDVDFNNKGALVPRLTTAERDAIVNPAVSLMIFNKDTQCYEGFNGAIWIQFGCIGCDPAEAPQTTSASNISENGFQANWGSVEGTGDVSYILDISENDNFSNFVAGYENYNAGSFTSVTLGDLDCGTTYFYRVRAMDGCGYSEYSNVINIETHECPIVEPCAGIESMTHNGFTYGVVSNPETGRCWLDRNLGASQVATSSIDEDSYGDLYQWGRGVDGHQLRTSSTTNALSNSDTPGHSDFIVPPNTPGATWDWRSPQNDNLWQGTDGINNPCPEGYRLPTASELSTEQASWSSYNAAGAFTSILKLTLAGFRHATDGSLNYVESLGQYWSSTLYTS